MEIVSLERPTSKTIDILFIIKVLCLVLITIKLTRMLCKRANQLERIVSKLSMPYYNCFDTMTQKDIQAHVQTLRNTILNRCIAIHNVPHRHNKSSKHVSFEIRKNIIYSYSQLKCIAGSAEVNHNCESHA
jgi:hypothetical protein